MTTKRGAYERCSVLASGQSGGQDESPPHRPINIAESAISPHAHSTTSRITTAWRQISNTFMCITSLQNQLTELEQVAESDGGTHAC